MHAIINQFLFLSAIVLQSGTGWKPILWTEPKRKLAVKQEFGGKLKKRYGKV